MPALPPAGRRSSVAPSGQFRASQACTSSRLRCRRPVIRSNLLFQHLWGLRPRLVLRCPPPPGLPAFACCPVAVAADPGEGRRPVRCGPLRTKLCYGPLLAAPSALPAAPETPLQQVAAISSPGASPARPACQLLPLAIVSTLRAGRRGVRPGACQVRPPLRACRPLRFGWAPCRTGFASSSGPTGSPACPAPPTDPPLQCPPSATTCGSRRAVPLAGRPRLLCRLPGQWDRPTLAAESWSQASSSHQQPPMSLVQRSGSVGPPSLRSPDRLRFGPFRPIPPRRPITLPLPSAGAGGRIGPSRCPALHPLSSSLHAPASPGLVSLPSRRVRRYGRESRRSQAPAGLASGG